MSTPRTYITSPSERLTNTNTKFQKLIIPKSINHIFNLKLINNHFQFNCSSLDQLAAPIHIPPSLQLGFRTENPCEIGLFSPQIIPSAFSRYSGPILLYSE